MRLHRTTWLRSGACRQALAWCLACACGVVQAAPAAPVGRYDTACPSDQGESREAITGLDYRTQRFALSNVESNHFTPVVENLVRGQNSDIAGDLDYVLNYYPNHHRALVAMARYAERSGANRAPNAKYTAECYYKRALNFRGDDFTVRSLYASFLIKKKRPQEALGQLAAVLKVAENNPVARYNAGLVYFEMGEYKLALEQAHFALKNDYANPMLADLLRKAGQWSEPPESAASAASAAIADQPAAASSSP